MTGARRWRARSSTRSGTSSSVTSRMRRSHVRREPSDIRRAAAWIESRVRADDAAELLAHHYVSALEYARAVGADVGDLSSRARERIAGCRAPRRCAQRFHERVALLRGCADTDARGRPRVAAPRARPRGGDHLRRRAQRRPVPAPRTRRSRRRRRRRCGAGGDGTGRVPLAPRRPGGSRRRTSRRSEELAAKMGEGEARLRVLANLGRFAMLSDEYERATGLARQALTLADHHGRDDMRAHALNTLGVARCSLGDRTDSSTSRQGSRYHAASAGLSTCGRRETSPRSSRRWANSSARPSCIGRDSRSRKEIGYEEPIRWLSTEIAVGLELAGEWQEARRMVDELIPGYDESPFWIEPQTRVCRARMLIAEGDVAQAVADADRAAALGREGRSFQSLCDPLGFRARLHAELGELDDARRVSVELVDAWVETRSAYLDQWVLDAWYAARRTDGEARLEAAIASLPPNPWTGAVIVADRARLRLGGESTRGDGRRLARGARASLGCRMARRARPTAGGESLPRSLAGVLAVGRRDGLRTACRVPARRGFVGHSLAGYRAGHGPLMSTGVGGKPSTGVGGKPAPAGNGSSTSLGLTRWPIH